jgi:hypothetical protein
MEQETDQTLTQLLSQKTTQKESNSEDPVSTAPVHADTKESTSPCQATVTGATTNCGENLSINEQRNIALEEFFSKSIELFRSQTSELNFVKYCKKEEEKIREKYS